MKRYKFSLVLFGALGLIIVNSIFALGQSFNDSNVEYTFELPDPLWKMTVKPSAANPNVEYAYGDRIDGYLEIRKMTVKENEIFSEIIQSDSEQKLQFLPGYVAGKQEEFAGSLKGKIYNYEFIKSGRPMSGRSYYVKSDPTTIYILRFTGLRDKLRIIRNQVDSIARTFKVKPN